MAADPVAALQAGASSSSGDASLTSPAALPPADEALGASNVAAAVLAIESLRTELQVSLQLLDLQEGSSEAKQLAALPAGVAEALAEDLAGLPAELLSSPRLERAAPPSVVTNRSAPFSPASSLPAAPSPARSPAASVHASAPASSSALSAQVAQMESFLERLVGSSAEQAARTAAATQLHQQERAARQRAQELAAEFAAQLAAVQVRARCGQVAGQATRTCSFWQLHGAVSPASAPLTSGTCCRSSHPTSFPSALSLPG